MIGVRKFDRSYTAALWYWRGECADSRTVGIERV
jgi:hypothetical protein